MHICDILSFRSVHPNLRDIIDNNSSLWIHMSFADSWPSEGNLCHFVKAAEKRNIEAAIKLAVAYLYKEGFKDDISKSSIEAAKFLCLAEHLTPNTFPFFWIFIRPPWSPDGSCSKVQTFQHIKDLLMQSPDLAFGVALTLKLQRLSSLEDSKSEEEKYFKLAVAQKSYAAAFFCMLDNITDEPDKAKDLERIRLLRRIASGNVLEAKLNLIRYYTQGEYGGISRKMALEFVHEFFGTSKPSGIHLTFNGGRTSDISRYILVDWLVEVVGMKDFSAHTLYLAVSMFDRFLQVRRVQRSQVQLLGVAAMVVSSRFLGFDILTIKEAAWLTDNSYTYHDVVRMMGELVAALNGNLRVLTIQDYIKVLVSIVGEVGYSAMLIEYIAMLCLLQSEMGQYSPAEIAASCLLLSRLLLNHADPWPALVQEWTGFSQDSLSLCTFHIYNKCLLEGSEVDYRETKLQSVKIRYADSNRFSVSNIEVIGHKELCRRLGVTKLVSHGKDSKAIKFRNTDELIMSPRRKMGPDYNCDLGLSFDEEKVDRINAATPPIKKVYALDEGISGYDGDLEDDSDESFSDKSDVLYELNEDDSDLDRSNIADSSEYSKDGEDEANAVDVISDTEMICGTNMFKCLQIDEEAHNVSASKITCLSSMCQSGTNMTCHSAYASPSSCISNCSCKKTYTSDASHSEKSPGLTSSGLSSSSPSLFFPSRTSSPLSKSFPQQSDINVQNVRVCLPCGSIQSVSKVSKKNKQSPCPNSCDTLPLGQDKLSVIEKNAPQFFSLRKTKSSHELATCSQPNKHEAVNQERNLKSKNVCLEVNEYDNNETYDAIDCKILSFNTHGDVSNKTQLLPPPMHSHDYKGSNSSPLSSSASSFQDYQIHHGLEYLYHESSPSPSSSYVLVNQTPGALPTRRQGTASYRQQQKPFYGQEHDNMLVPATPESAPDSHLTRAGGAMHENFHGSNSSLGYVLKKARLDYSYSFKPPGDHADEKLSQDLQTNHCDKTSFSVSPNGEDQQHNASIKPLLRRKRKSCI
ncbi:unnamed protein product [Lymnaea stagnalis]|uniref:Cyclin-F n=1 Tax=Lymnaea stagnalis TaxID=6523 RepID=A0AAV2H197_LYMST